MVITRYILDTGVVFAWKDSSGEWQNSQIRPDSSYNYEASMYIGDKYSNVSVCAYDGNNFDFNSETSYWNKTKLATSKEQYDREYKKYSAELLTANGTYNNETGNIVIIYDAVLNASGGQDYNVKDKLALGEKQEILDLLGNPSQEIVDAMNLMDPSSESYSENVEGYLYFTPVVIQYDVTETVEVEDPPEAPADPQ